MKNRQELPGDKKVSQYLEQMDIYNLQHKKKRAENNGSENDSNGGNNSGTSNRSKLPFLDSSTSGLRN